MAEFAEGSTEPNLSTQAAAVLGLSVARTASGQFEVFHRAMLRLRFTRQARNTVEAVQLFRTIGKVLFILQQSGIDFEPRRTAGTDLHGISSIHCWKRSEFLPFHLPEACGFQAEHRCRQR